MNLESLGKAIAKYGAPILGGVVAGPAGATIGQLVASAFNGDLNDPESIIQTIAADPQSRLKLAEIQSSEKIELQRLLILGERMRLENESKQLELTNENTKNAREENTKQKTHYPQFLSTVVVIGFFACIYWVAAYHQDKADEQVLYLLLGIIGTSFNAVVNYWIGSSAEKNFDLKK